MEPIEHVVEVAVGLETSVNDPFVVTRGVRAVVALRPTPWLGAVTTLGWAPNLGVAAYTERTRALYEQNGLLPSISTVGGTVTQAVEVTPVRLAAGRDATALHLSSGLALVSTDDDFGGGGAPDAIALASKREVHLGWTLGVAADAWRGPLGVRLSATRVSYLEHYAGRVQPRAPVLIGASIGYRR